VRRTGEDWRPGASIDTLRRRAAILARIRAFFAGRGVLEVDTPQLYPATATDPLLGSISACPFDDADPWYLQTSPEFAMKRLLAAGSGPVYQLAHAFRRGECGPRHNPEFTMLEWYRPGFDLPLLIAEVVELVTLLIGERPLREESWGRLFERHVGVDPFATSDDALRALAAANGADSSGWTREDLLDLLFSMLVEPGLGRDCLHVVSGFPAERASLARLTRDESGNAVADRFELFIDGLEIANGYNELGDAEELRLRMAADNRLRRDAGSAPCAADEKLLAAMRHGLPDCAGVALGVDRLIMIALGIPRIDQVIAFSATHA
jgi:elongation factor P--(R)-beta-lysine ligase